VIHFLAHSVAAFLVGQSPILTKHIRSSLRALIVRCHSRFLLVSGVRRSFTPIWPRWQYLDVALSIVRIKGCRQYGQVLRRPDRGGPGVGLTVRENSFALACGMMPEAFSTEVIVATLGGPARAS